MIDLYVSKMDGNIFNFGSSWVVLHLSLPLAFRFELIELDSGSGQVPG